MTFVFQQSKPTGICGIRSYSRRNTRTIRPSINIDTIPGITSGEKAVAKALQKYGAYAIDCGGSPMGFPFQKPVNEPDPYPSVGFSSDYFDMPHIPWDKIRVLAAWNSYDAQPGVASPTTAIPTQIIPTLYCLGSCPTLPVSESPTFTQSPVPTIKSTQTPTNQANTTNTPAASSPTIDPCASQTSSVTTMHFKHHRKFKSGASGFFEFLFRLIELLLKLLFGGSNPLQPPTPTPLPVPTISVVPTTTVQPCPTISKTGSLVPTTNISPAIAPTGTETITPPLTSNNVLRLGAYK